MNRNENWILNSEPEATFTFVRSGKQACRIKETGEFVTFNSSTGWLTILDEDGFWVDKYKPVFDSDGTVITYEDYYANLMPK